AATQALTAARSPSAGEARRLAQRRAFSGDAAQARTVEEGLDPCDPWRGALAGVRSNHAAILFVQSAPNAEPAPPRLPTSMRSQPNHFGRLTPPRTSRVAWRQGFQGSKQHLALTAPPRAPEHNGQKCRDAAPPGRCSSIPEPQVTQSAGWFYLALMHRPAIARGDGEPAAATGENSFPLPVAAVPSRSCRK